MWLTSVSKSLQSRIYANKIVDKYFCLLNDSVSLTKNLDNDGVHLHASRALQIQNVFASIISVDILHHHHGVRVGGFDDNALAVLDVGVHLCPGDPGSGTALDGGREPHDGSGIQLQALLQLCAQLCLGSNCMNTHTG